MVSRLGLQNRPDQPERPNHVNASVLKVRLAMAIMGIWSIHLLTTFIAAGEVGLPVCGTADFINAVTAHAQALAAGMSLAAPTCTRVTQAGVTWQTIIHGGFILSAIGIAYTDRLMTSSTAKREHAAH